MVDDEQDLERYFGWAVLLAEQVHESFQVDPPQPLALTVSMLDQVLQHLQTLIERKIRLFLLQVVQEVMGRAQGYFEYEVALRTR